MNEKQIIYFICSPNLGILDNWLPILYYINQKDPLIKIVMIIPKAGSVEEIDVDNILIKTAEGIFSQVVFRWYAGGWGCEKSLSDAKRAIRRTKAEKALFMFARKFSSRRLSLIEKPLVWAVNLLDAMDLWRTRFKLSSLNKKQAALVYDIHEETKDYNREVIHILHGLYRYSIFHGVDINSNINVDRDHLVTLGDKLKVYLFSREEEAYYQKRFGLSGQHMEVVGIPRHDKDWVEFIRSKQVESTGAIQEKECAVLFSRSMSPYFPPDRKRRALRAVKEVVIEKYGLNLLIKLHPKEHQDGMFYDVFGENEFDKSWSISNEHPFVLAEKCAFAITFYSGVAIDMNMLGVPVAEYLDLRGLPDYDNVDSLRVDGVPVLSFRYLGLVKGVSTPKQLESAVTEFVEGGGMAQRYSKRYDELFPRQSKLSSHIATELIDSISAEAPISER